MDGLNGREPINPWQYNFPIILTLSNYVTNSSPNQPSVVFNQKQNHRLKDSSSTQVQYNSAVQEQLQVKQVSNPFMWLPWLAVQILLHLLKHLICWPICTDLQWQKCLFQHYFIRENLHTGGHVIIWWLRGW